MAKAIGPLMSLDATGTLAGTITFTHWKGRNVIRQRVTPSNPQTAAQTGVRSTFGGEVALWKANQATLTGPFSAMAAAGNYSPFNAFTSANQKRYSRNEHVANDPNPTPVAPISNITGLAAVAAGKYIDVSWSDAADADAWATEIYMNPTVDPTGTWAQMVALKPRGNSNLTIGPLPAGTYKISGQAVTKTGGVDALVLSVEVVVN